MIGGNRDKQVTKVVIFHTSQGPSAKRDVQTVLTLLLSLCLATLLLFTWQDAQASSKHADVWLAIDTEQLHLAIMKGETPLKVFQNIAIGSNGPSVSKVRGDATTPLGEFKITEIRPSKRFELFMAINYPNLDHTERAFEDSRIDMDEYRALRGDLDRGDPPDQSTSLGGQLGIHGLGTGDAGVHRSINWTEGCIALTNEQLVELQGWVDVGTRVVVR
jgi:murein L,D-transpeptidase YafK